MLGYLVDLLANSHDGVVEHLPLVVAHGTTHAAGTWRLLDIDADLARLDEERSIQLITLGTIHHRHIDGVGLAAEGELAMLHNQRVRGDSRLHISSEKEGVAISGSLNGSFYLIGV